MSKIPRFANDVIIGGKEFGVFESVFVFQFFQNADLEFDKFLSEFVHLLCVVCANFVEAVRESHEVITAVDGQLNCPLISSRNFVHALKYSLCSAYNVARSPINAATRRHGCLSPHSCSQNQCLFFVERQYRKPFITSWSFSSATNDDLQTNHEGSCAIDQQVH